MRLFRSHSWQKNVTLAIMLLSLLLQVQTVFACQMMDRSGVIEHCCCGEIAKQQLSNKDQSLQASCCDISSELSLTDGELESTHPNIPSNFVSFELSQAALAIILVSLWPDINVYDQPIQTAEWDFQTDPGSPGTSTYLTTSRLRI